MSKGDDIEERLINFAVRIKYLDKNFSVCGRGLMLISG
jgi:hypothetical protein